MIGFYDNVHLMMWGYHEVSPHLGNVVQKVSSDGEVIGEVGGYDGLRVGVYNNGTSIIGSFAKFLHGGSNIELLNVYTMQEAIEKLSDGLHVDVNQAQVTSVEFGTQFPMAEAVGAYLCRMGGLSRYKRSTLSEGNLESLYYEQRTKKLKFYDKGHEAQSKGMKLPDGCRHLLKYELTLKKRLKKTLGFIPMASDLYNKDIYRQLAVLWRDLYYRIDKQKRPTMSKQEKLTANAFFKRVSGDAMLLLGEEFIQSSIEDFKAMGASRTEQYRLKQLIKKATSSSNLDELISELNDCIDNAVAYL